MKSLFNRNTVLLLGLISPIAALAQYPVIPDSLKKLAAERENTENIRLEKVWEKAQEAMKAEGKPYIPWAAKPSDLPQAKIKAFPGAEGGGAFTAGGRGGKVFVVTSLADSGPGTLREACEAGGARIVVFNVAGIIQLEKPIVVKAPYITIAGQTAPGDGICVAGESFLIDTHDVILRFLRLRRGQTDVTRRDDAVGGNVVGNIMIDHVSASWGLDENMSIYRHVYDREGKNLKLPTVNITIQNSIFSECLDAYNHAFGSTIGGLNSTFMRNLWASNISRNPSIGMYGDFGFVNNVIWNWWNRSADGGDNRSLFNFINNYYKPGPITPKDKPIAYRILKPESGRDKAFKDQYGKVYAHGNVVEGFPKVTKDNWAGGIQIEDLPNVGEREKEIRVDKAFPMAPVTTLSAQDAYNYVLENVGAFLPKQDAVDTRIIKQVAENKVYYNQDKTQHGFVSPYVKRRLPADSYKQGIISDIAQVGGYPVYQGVPYQDADNDGIPDDVEKNMGLNPNDPSDSRKIAKNGYANIENYLNGVVALDAVVPKK
ncbi:MULTISPECIES: polysaccharide lyase [Sphingobacterium]|uniref:Polysaccharide lyase n=1 Tax=Sphingobacterium athyrii TaxID=2152717 RepID=A0A363NS06_9SPHI|nr:MULTISPECIES: polysaccharide lyase [Sphingobacterium]PUV23554.1 polysaccharide lyase [Sphingobacterium athyrii]QIH36423.1 polysaccharide lyase [Sphingobacterium sp. DR205]